MKEVNEIKRRVQDNKENIINFLREIVAIPSMEEDDRLTVRRPAHDDMGLPVARIDKTCLVRHGALRQGRVIQRHDRRIAGLGAIDGWVVGHATSLHLKEKLQSAPNVAVQALCDERSEEQSRLQPRVSPPSFALTSFSRNQDIGLQL